MICSNLQRLTGTLGGAPARDQTLGACGGTAFWQGDGMHVLIKLCRLSQFDQHDVIVDGVTIILRVANDDSRSNELLRAVLVTDVVLTQTQLDLLVSVGQWIQKPLEKTHIQSI